MGDRWQQRFDESGPTWEGNIESMRREELIENRLLAETNRRAVEAKERKEKLKAQVSPKLKEIDAEMESLYKQERKLMKQLSKKQNPEIEERIKLIRIQFHSVREEYLNLMNKIR